MFSCDAEKKHEQRDEKTHAKMSSDEFEAFDARFVPVAFESTHESKHRIGENDSYARDAR
jgi:hypothetical protein